ncbi:WW domain-containing protein [Entamoeba marina]
MQRSKYFGGKRDFTKITGFYGSHFRMPPSYEEIQKNLPVGFEQIEMENGLTYYANHFARTTSYAIDMDDDCDIPYPLYNASMLPSGWSLGKSYGEWYFIDHNTHQTTWVDPRPLEMRTIPHVEKKKKAKFTVQISKAIGLPVLGWGNPDPYCCMKDINGKWVNTDVVNKMLDINFKKKRNTMEITIDKDRENVVLYMYDHHKFTFDAFMGGVNFDLQYFPPNVVIEDWFGLENFGDKSRAVTGKVLLRVCYHVDDNINPPLAQIKGHSIINLDYYPDTRLIRDQIKKQNEVRKKLKLRENPMLDYEGTIICESI